MKSSPLQHVDFVCPDGTPIPGLIPICKHASTTTDANIEELVAIKDASSFTRIDYIYFRRFADGRSPQVAAYVVDNTNQALSTAELATLHRQVWLHGTAPLIYIAWPSRIDVLTCARGADFWRKETSEGFYNPASTLKLAANIAGELEAESNRFSAFRLADGTFWEDPRNDELTDYAKAAHQSLIQAVVDVDTDLEGDKNPSLRRLLLLMVLIKYLEDRKVFPDHWFSNFRKGARTFSGVLQGGEPDEVYRLLSVLERKFNGDVFSLPSEGSQRLTKKSLFHFADLVEAKTLGRQRYLWEQFSFEHLPVEIISHLYQHFVKDGHGTVYTPPFLAALLLGQVMPYDKLTGDERILDPACGSGVFLVGAFRRLINVWRSRHKWRRPDVNTLKSILKNNIFGVDLDSNAIDLASFSLCLAICDALRPEVIWQELKFDRLRDNNLLQMDFFALLRQARENAPTILKPFDILIGNPPFEHRLTEIGADINRDARQQDKNRGTLPYKETAHLFLEQALGCLRPSGRICMIQPAGILYNRKAGKFFGKILKSYRIDTILDFTSIRKLYEADPKTVAICATAEKPTNNHIIDHWTFRRTASVNERICFELDHYDRHRVSQRCIEKEPGVWRANLLGGGRLADIAKRFQGLRTLSKYVLEKKWNYGEGFIAATSGKRTPAPFLTGKELLPTEAFTESGIDEKRLSTVHETLFRSAYTPERFSPPLILFKESETLPVTYWNKRFIAYRDKIVGIHAPQSEAAEHARLYQFIKDNHKMCRFICTLNGSQSLVGKATAILKQDIDLLPYPENLEEFSFSFWEDALGDDVVDYMTEYVRLGQNSQLLKSAADDKVLHEYTALFIRMLGSVYDDLHSCKPIFLNGLICQPFYFGERPNLTWLGNSSAPELRQLVYFQNHEHLRTIRVVRLYLDNVLIVVKPDRLRYWIRSTAIRDADDTIVDLRQQGY